MNILPDTHTLIWALNEPARLSLSVTEDLTDRRNTVFFSAASIWEIGIKASRGRQDFSFDPSEVAALPIDTGFLELPVYSVHGAGVVKLPWHHRAPFDRLLVAQASALPAYLYTNDDALLPYSASLSRCI